MSMNPLPPAPTKTQQVGRKALVVAVSYAPAILVVLGIIIGFILGRA